MEGNQLVLKGSTSRCHVQHGLGRMNDGLCLTAIANDTQVGHDGVSVTEGSSTMPV